MDTWCRNAVVFRALVAELCTWPCTTPPASDALFLATALTGSLVMSPGLKTPARAQDLNWDGAGATAQGTVEGGSGQGGQGFCVQCGVGRGENLTFGVQTQPFTFPVGDHASRTLDNRNECHVIVGMQIHFEHKINVA